MTVIELRWHGRGGQGAVTAAQALATAAIMEGKYAQSYPEYGAERRGAPVKAYTKISTEPILDREPVLNPNIIIVLDKSLLSIPEVLTGLKQDGYLIINSRSPVNLSGPRMVYLDATGLATKLLGKPIVNTAMLGAVARVLGDFMRIDSITAALSQYFSGKVLSINKDLVLKAYEATML
ncbi:MAG: 2-oxoacid:acceptor oxidoreductase family protein [Thermocladium sp.]|jgi:pyruvate ferredoxin oxidoreductase gamma subunit